MSNGNKSNKPKISDNLHVPIKAPAISGNLLHEYWDILQPPPVQNAQPNQSKE